MRLDTDAVSSSMMMVMVYLQMMVVGLGWSSFKIKLKMFFFTRFPNKFDHPQIKFERLNQERELFNVYLHISSFRFILVEVFLC